MTKTAEWVWGVGMAVILVCVCGSMWLNEETPAPGRPAALTWLVIIASIALVRRLAVIVDRRIKAQKASTTVVEKSPDHN